MTEEKKPIITVPPINLDEQKRDWLVNMRMRAQLAAGAKEPGRMAAADQEEFGPDL